MPRTDAQQVKSDVKLDRVAARVPHEVKQRWIRAADLRGQTLTDFIIVAANAATTAAFSENERIELSERDQMKLAEMLLHPPKLTDAMKNALSRELLRIENAKADG